MWHKGLRLAKKWGLRCTLTCAYWGSSLKHNGPPLALGTLDLPAPDYNTPPRVYLGECRVCRPLCYELTLLPVNLSPYHRVFRFAKNSRAQGNKQNLRAIDLGTRTGYTSLRTLAIGPCWGLHTSNCLWYGRFGSC